MDEAKLQNYIAAETAAMDEFTYDYLFDNNQCEIITDCDGNSVVTVLEWTVANCFKLKIVIDESHYDNYYHTSMYLDDKEVFSWPGVETPVFLNSILIECICDVDTEQFTVDDTL